jgi:hypothetical protein
MIKASIVETIDTWLDENVAAAYKDQPLAQDWARVAKISEELGEAIAELILYTGQNPRKGQHAEARETLLAELADTALTGIYAIQHFTKDIYKTAAIIREAQMKHFGRTL